MEFITLLLVIYITSYCAHFRLEMSTFKIIARSISCHYYQKYFSFITNQLMVMCEWVSYISFFSFMQDPHSVYQLVLVSPTAQIFIIASRFNCQ